MAFNKEAGREFVNKLDSFSERRQPSFEKKGKGIATSYTDSGGGASFRTEGLENGNFRGSRIRLNKFRERTDRQGLKDKAAHFMDAGGRAAEALKPEENEAAVSNVDDKAVLAAAILNEKFNDEKLRFAEISEEKKNEVRHLKGKIRSERQTIPADGKIRGERQAAPADEKIRGERRTIPADGKFLNTRAEFADRGGGFLDRYRDAFKDRNLNAFSGITDSGGGNGSSLEKVQYGEGGAQPEGRFSETTAKADGSKGRKSVSSYFSNKSDELDDRSFISVSDWEKINLTSDREKLALEKSERKSAKKAKSKAVRRAAATAAVANMLRAKKELQNDAAGMNPTGDLLKDGSGMLRAAVDGIKAAIENKARVLMMKAVSVIVAGLLHIVAAAMPLIVMVVIVIMVMTSFMSVFTDSSNIPEGDGNVYSSLSETEINDIIESLYETMPDSMDSRRESLLRYALSKVGCGYDQAMHWSLTADVFDCSSLAYRAYRDAGIDISNGGIYSAAEICRKAAGSGSIAYGDLKPGDLIFYGGSGNGRYLGIYHVAIYVGGGKMVEARGRSSGVVYCDARAGSVVGYSRYM